MEWIEVMKQRHSVRQYTDQKIPMEIQEKLKAEVERLNTESNLHMQLFFDEPDCFDSRMAHYGKFTNVKNYLSIVGKKEPKLEEKTGYYS